MPSPLKSVALAADDTIDLTERDLKFVPYPEQSAVIPSGPKGATNEANLLERVGNLSRLLAFGATDNSLIKSQVDA